MKKKILTFGFLFCVLVVNAQDYFPIIPGSYWFYDVYQDGVNSYQDSVVYNESLEINDTTFHLFIHNYIENDLVTMKDTFYLYDNSIDNNTIMLSNRNMPVVDSAIYAKHNYSDGESWVYNKLSGNDTIHVEFIDNYSVASGTYTDCFLQGDEYYFAPDIGIIKIKLWNDESYYDLKSYYIPTETPILVNILEDFKTYPNQTSNYIEFKDLRSGNYHIYNLIGHTVSSGSFSDSKINVNELKRGIYLLSIETSKNNGIIRFIKD